MINVNLARVDVNFQSHYFFYFDISQHKVPLIFHIKFQPNIPCHLGEIDLNVRIKVLLLGSM